MQGITQGLQTSFAAFASHYQGESGHRQPVHTVYGGAHLFKSDTAIRLGVLALRSFETYARDAKTFAQVLELPWPRLHRIGPARHPDRRARS